MVAAQLMPANRANSSIPAMVANPAIQRTSSPTRSSMSPPSGSGVDPAQVGVVGAVGVAVHGGEAVAHAGPAGPAVLQAEDVAELVAGGLAPGGGVGQVAGVEVQAAVPGGVGPGVVIEGGPAGLVAGRAHLIHL